MTCVCGHDQKRHCDRIGRCDGQAHDPEYGTYACVCPVYRQAQTIPEQLDAARTGQEFGSVLQGLFTALEKSMDEDTA